MESLFDSVLGLPVHPLVVHAAVVLLPLSAISLILAAFSAWWRARFAGASLALLTVAVVAAFVAKESGEALTRHVGTPVDHARWADLLVPVSIVLWLVALAWFVLGRRDGKAGLQRIAGVVMAVLAAAGLVLVTLVGHSGAQATWTDATKRVQPGGTSAVSRNYSMEQVAQHASASSCWTVVNKHVYDVTTWVGQHPGGEQNILQLCGKDGTKLFEGKHGGEGKPEQTLETYKIGVISDGDGDEG